MVRLIPRDEKFFELFIKDGENLLEAARKLEAMVATYDRLDERIAEIQALEKRGDEIDDEIARRLERSFITPFDREDIHMLVSRLDDVIDLMDGAARRYEMLHIKDVRPEGKELARVLAEAADHLQQAVAGIKKPAEVERQVGAVKTLEEEADAIYEQAISALFANGGDPLDVLRWKEMFDTLERTTDYCMRVAQVLRSVSLKNA
jgi:hypothetical protein